MMGVEERYRILKYIGGAEYRTYKELKAFCDFDAFIGEALGRTVTQRISGPDGQVTYALNEDGRRFVADMERAMQKDKRLRRELRFTRCVAYTALGLGLAALLLARGCVRLLRLRR